MGDVEAAAAGHFMALAVQYLVAGRAAAALKLSSIPGNLLHHAIEMELKSLLVSDIGLEKLRQRKYGHNLASLWLAAVGRHPDLGSSARQATVEQLDRFESLRYPDDMIEQGAAIRLGWTASDPLPALTVPSYDLVMEDLDDLFQAIFVATGRNPLVSLAGLSEAALAAMRDRNRYPIG
jgi:hypothetical protein